MKRRDLIKLLEKNDWYLKRNGGNHDIYTNGVTTSQSLDRAKLKRILRKRSSNGEG